MNAKFIFTDSYHGTLFSLKFKKPFIAYYSEAIRSTRFIDLGKRYCVSDNIVTNVNEINLNNDWEKKIEFSKISEAIEEHKLASMSYLNQVISSK